MNHIDDFAMTASAVGSDPAANDDFAFNQAPQGEGKKYARRIAVGTPQQEALWAELVNGQTHVLVEARAGCGKSSSCREGMFRMLDAQPALKIRYAVFNKANAEEFRTECPPGVDVGTTHSFGYAVLKVAFKSQIEKNKTYVSLDGIPGGQRLPRWLRKAVAAIVSQAKNQMLRPDDPDLCAKLCDLVTRYDIRVYRDLAEAVSFAARCLIRAADWTELVDFDDMLWLPALLGLEFPACDVLFVDEAQDLSPTQHAMLPLLCPGGRIVGVGDSHQAIYAFRGADAESLLRLASLMAGTPRGFVQLPLTVTFRCPKSHVALAREFVPDIMAHDTNAEGTVENDVGLGDALQRIRPGEMFLCSANAPLVGAALRLIRQKRKAVVKGRAIGQQLLEVVNSFGPVPTVADLCSRVERWRNAELGRLSQREGVEDLVEQVGDRANSLLALAQGCETPAELPRLILSLFTEDVRGGGVVFSTIHRAKGLEADAVWLLDTATREPRAEWEFQQQQNLRYVALTRSKDRLAFVIPDSFSMTYA